MTYKRAGGSTRNGRNSESKHPGVGLFGGRVVKANNTLARQRGIRSHAGYGVGLGKNCILFVRVGGMVRSETRNAFGRKYVSIVAA